MCKLIVHAMVSAVSLLETLSCAERPAYLLAYLPCAAAVAPVWRWCWYAVWMKRQRCNHVLLVSAFLYQSSMLRVNIPQRIRKLIMFINSYSYVYGTFTMIAISWQSAHLLSNSLGESCGLVQGQEIEVILAHCIGSWFTICYHQLIEYVVQCHCAVPSYGWWRCRGHDFEGVAMWLLSVLYTAQ
jgi:hypothetical protein